VPDSPVVTTTPDISVVIVSFNTREMTLACLASVFDQAREATLEVIVLDNASTDGSAEAIRQQFPKVRLLAREDNLGFAGGNNVAAGEATGRYLLLLNPDTVILDRAIDKAFAFSERHPNAIVGGRTFFGDGSLNRSSCHGWPTLWGVTCQGLGLSSLFRRSRLFNPEGLGAWDRSTDRRVPVVTGCFLMLPRDVWERLGGFDESFFMYGEETDLCMRAAKLGIDRWICGDATLIHYGGASDRVRADKMVKLFQAKAKLYRKHWSPAAAAYGVAMLRLWAASRALAGRLGSRAGAWPEIWRRRREFLTV
jgi:GT2 family glycosyltransferase